MDSVAEQVLSAALNLPENDRIELIEALIESFQVPDQPPFDETWREVIERRSTEWKAGQVEGLPWSEVRTLARESIGG